MEIYPFDQLPEDQVVVNVTFDFAYAVSFACTYISSEQNFVINQSGLIVPAYKVLYWESITL